ncbi:MAG: Ig-like domain-containing protein [Lachnospiraceae bacterium]
MKTIKTFPNLQLSVELPYEQMYDETGKIHTEFPKGLSEGIWLSVSGSEIPKDVEFGQKEYSIREGQTSQLTLTNLPSGVQTSQFSFVSSNPEIVTVDSNGLITAVSVGTANVTASYEKYKCTCKITVIEKGFYVEEIEDVIYSGSAVKPEVVVYDNDSILTEGVDYTLAYANNIAAADKDSKNAPKVTVTGKGNYSGKVVATFTILPYNIEDGDVSVSLPQSVLIANSKVQKPAPVVTFNGKKLAANKDYTVSYPQLAEEGAYKNPGTYDVQVTFKNNFTGSETVSVEIKEGTPISKVKVGAIAKQPYTGSAIEVKPVITMGNETLVEGTHYTLSYVNNILPGKATVKVNGMGAYAGEKTLTFEITGTSLSKAQVTGITDKTYNGKIQLQDLKVSLDNGVTFLTEGVDYKVVYEKNMNVGTAKVKIVGAGGYVGSINKTFRILPYNISTDADNALSGIPENLVVSYIKGGCKPELTLMFHEYRIDQKKECTISYTNNAKPGNASDTKAPTITIKGKGNFTGTITIPFTIMANDLSAEDTSVKLTVADIAFVNKAGKYISTPVLMDSNGKKLAAGTDYENTIVYTMGGKVLDPKKDIVPVGSEVTVTVTGKGFYTGTMSATYRITEKTFTSAKITIAKQTYTGKPIQLKAEDMKVVIGKDTLVYGVDFEVVEDSYINNVAKGNASVTIKGIGKYGGMKTVKFAIVPKGIN